MSVQTPCLPPAPEARVSASACSGGSDRPADAAGLRGRRAHDGVARDVDLGSCGAADLDALYRRHQPMVYRFCLGIMRTPEEAADVAQSTWMQAMVALSAPHIVVRNVPSWLRTIAQNECFDVLRARGALRTLDISALELSSDTTPADVHDTREQLDCLLADLHELSERQRSAIVLREICGLTSEELADALGTTSERASGLVADARQTLIRRRDGRALECTDVRRQLRQGRQRSIGLRAHLEACGPCQSVERRRRGRALSSLALLPWSLVRPLLERWEAITTAPVAVKSAVAGALIVAGLGTSLPIVVPESPNRTGASQRSGAATTAATAPRTRASVRAIQGPTPASSGRGAPTSRAGSADPPPSPAAANGSVAAPAPILPGAATSDLPAATPADDPVPVDQNSAVARRTVRETVAATDQAVRKTTAALEQAVRESTAGVAQTVQETAAVADAALKTTVEATDRALDAVVSGATQPPG